MPQILKILKLLTKTLRQMRHLPRLRRLNQIRPRHKTPFDVSMEQAKWEREKMPANGIDDMSPFMPDFSKALQAQINQQYGSYANTISGSLKYPNMIVSWPMIAGASQQIPLPPVFSTVQTAASTVGALSGMITEIEFATAGGDIVNILVDVNYTTLLYEISLQHAYAYKKHVEDFSLSDMEWAEQMIEEYGAKNQSKVA